LQLAVENGDPAKDVHSRVTHVGALHPETTCSFKLLVPCPGNAFGMVRNKIIQMGVQIWDRQSAAVAKQWLQGHDLLQFCDLTVQHHDNGRQFGKGSGHALGWRLDAAIALHQHQPHSVQGAND
jgi:hypothetical protein